MAKRKNKQNKGQPTVGSPSPLEDQPTPTKPGESIAAKFQQYSGPLPLPEQLNGYEEIQEGFAERILAMAENEQRQRHSMEERLLSAEIEHNRFVTEQDAKDTQRGQWLGFTIGTVALFCGTYAAISGAQTAGSLIGSGGVIGLVTAFIIGRGREKKESAASRKQQNASSGPSLETES